MQQRRSFAVDNLSTDIFIRQVSAATCDALYHAWQTVRQKRLHTRSDQRS